jgi:hypothetical protein
MHPGVLGRCARPLLVCDVMLLWGSLALASVMAGPPKLPPMPGQGAPPPDPVTAKLPTQPTPAKPSAPATAKPTAPAPDASSKPATTPAPSASPTTTTTTDVPTPTFVPPNAEPPQPEPATNAPPPRDGAGASPPMRDDRGRDDRSRGDRLPGGDDEMPVKKMPPPLRPPYKGIGLFTGAGVMLGVALAEQIASHIIVKRRCIEPAAEQAAMTDPFDDDSDVEDVGNAILKCVPGVLPVVALRVNSDLALVAMIGMATAGAILRAERIAYDDVFAGRMSKRIPKLRGAGVGLIAVGAATWLTLGPASWGVLAKCDDAKCAGRARAMGFTTRTIGAALVAAGAAMLGFSESYRRKHEQFNRERALLWAPMFGRGLAGVSVQQRF